MNIHLALKALKDHAQEEARIHKEVFSDAGEDLRNLAKKHLRDTMMIHKTFWNDLKKSVGKK